MHAFEITYEAAWFVSHRIREAMRSGDLAPMGGVGGSGIVEADETFVGTKPGAEKRRGFGHKNAVLALVERGGVNNEQRAVRMLKGVRGKRLTYRTTDRQAEPHAGEEAPI